MEDNKETLNFILYYINLGFIKIKIYVDNNILFNAYWN